jgi:hypothetical protein
MDSDEAREFIERARDRVAKSHILRLDDAERLPPGTKIRAVSDDGTYEEIHRACRASPAEESPRGVGDPPRKATVTVLEAAKALELSPSTVHAMCALGRLGHSRAGEVEGRGR